MAEPTISVNTITKLTDAAQTLFQTLHELEHKYKAAAQKQHHQSRSALLDLDVFRNSTLHEEPDEWRGK